ncbi:hypothetical protein FQN49_001625 [Arthroderma sp. PD_2]|nr:hypothetical protein FQN49_001625 [Arthroderma sp. PD_2]
MSDPAVKKIGNFEYMTRDERRYRRVGTIDWIPIEAALSEHTGPPLLLSLVRLTQIEGEPDHWALTAAREGQAGAVYQVTGDAIACTPTTLKGRNSLPQRIPRIHSSWPSSPRKRRGWFMILSIKRYPRAPPVAQK